MLKKCTKCKEDKSVKDFGKKLNKEHGNSVCKECVARYQREMRQSKGLVKYKTGEPKHNLLGQKFGSLIVKELGSLKASSGCKFRNWHWWCECECGNRIEVSGVLLKKNLRTSCGCYISKTKSKNTGVWSGYKEISGTYWNNVIRNAKTRNKDFIITIEEAWELYEKQRGKCALSGIEIKFAPTYKRYKEKTVSLDRINSNIGYTKQNCQWIHKTVQKMKNNLSEDIFIDFCIKIKENFDEKI